MLCVKCVTLCGYKIYYIMRKSYYVMHKFITLCEKVITLCVIITLCGNYYVMRRHNVYALTLVRLVADFRDFYIGLLELVVKK